MSLKLNNIVISDMDFIAQSSLSWKVLQNKTIMVTGGGGFIGNHLIDRLKSEGVWVRGVDLKYPKYSETVAVILLLAI